MNNKQETLELNKNTYIKKRRQVIIQLEEDPKNDFVIIAKALAEMESGKTAGKFWRTMHRIIMTDTPDLRPNVFDFLRDRQN